MLKEKDLQQLVQAEPGLWLSLYLRTDPRDPENTNHNPAWAIELRNGLRALSEDGLERDQRLKLRKLVSELEERITHTSGAERARSLCWFVPLSGEEELTLSSQLPLRESSVGLAELPRIKPLADLADRGQRTGLILANSDTVRLLQWEDGATVEPAQSVYQLELGDWAEYHGFSAAHPGRGVHTGSNHEAYEDRVADNRHRFFRDAATAIERRLPKLGWERVMLVCEREIGDGLSSELGDQTRRRMTERVEANLLWEEPSQVADALLPHLREVWESEKEQLAREICERAGGGDRAVSGWSQVAEAALAGRVEKLLVAAGASPEPGVVSLEVAEQLGASGDVSEDLTRTVLGASGEVSVLQSDSRALASCEGIAAELRY